MPRDVSVAWGGRKRLCLAEGTAVAVQTPGSVPPPGSCSVSVQGVGVLGNPVPALAAIIGGGCWEGDGWLHHPDTQTCLLQKSAF